MSDDGRPTRAPTFDSSGSPVGRGVTRRRGAASRRGGPLPDLHSEDSPDTTDATAADRTAITVARRADEQPETTEISRLADAAGYTVVDALCQRRREDGAYNVGRGKAEELGRRVVETGADAVVFDNELTPGQYRDLSGLLPDGTRIVDRHRLVLDIFGERTGNKAARLQVELATLRYERPRIKQTEERTHLQEAAETGSRLVDTERRIRTVERKLRAVSERANERRKARREEGFDLVAIAGYTNAGKSTLLHRLADDLSVDSLDPAHADLDGEAAVEDRLFKTLDTTTRRATIAGRRLLLTDTVGLIDGLPHDLVASFSTTLDAVADSDVALLVVDASDPVDDLREKVRVSMRELSEPRGEVIAVLNKTDLLAGAELAARREALPASVTDCVAVSAIEGEGIDALRGRVADALPRARETFDLPNSGETQAFLAWAHDHGRVDVAYAGDRVAVTFEARPDLLARAASKAARIGE